MNTEQIAWILRAELEVAGVPLYLHSSADEKYLHFSYEGNNVHVDITGCSPELGFTFVKEGKFYYATSASNNPKFQQYKIYEL